LDEELTGWSGLKRILLALLMLILAIQLTYGLLAWRDEAVAEGRIQALEGTSECLGDVTTLEARRLDHLATVNGVTLSVEDRWRVDCYLRAGDRRQAIERAQRDFTNAQMAIMKAATLGSAAATMIGILSALGWISRRKAATRNSSSDLADGI
jgi:hypothetical protein